MSTATEIEAKVYYQNVNFSGLDLGMMVYPADTNRDGEKLRKFTSGISEIIVKNSEATAEMAVRDLSGRAILVVMGSRMRCSVNADSLFNDSVKDKVFFTEE